MEETLSSRRIYEGRVLALRLDEVRLPDGRYTTREIVEHSASVGVVAVDSEGQVILVRQYRYAVGEALLEIVAGGVDDGEDVEAAALRELEEETGYRAGKLQLLFEGYLSPGFCTELMHFCWATELAPGPQRPAEDEDIEVVRLPLAQAPDLIRSGQIRDSKSVAGLLAAISARS
ncbi:MAG: NUDIX hydrolase [Actinobacteria bacterium]|nr:NUDIX hydrolase [Actinomycetota bacterium]